MSEIVSYVYSSLWESLFVNSFDKCDETSSKS